jgi:hypothetical protein
VGSAVTVDQRQRLLDARSGLHVDFVAQKWLNRRPRAVAEAARTTLFAVGTTANPEPDVDHEGAEPILDDHVLRRKLAALTSSRA